MHRRLRRGLIATAVLALVAGTLWAPAAGAAARKGPVRYVGTSNVRTAASASVSSRTVTKPSAPEFPAERADDEQVGSEGGNSLYANQLPSTGSLPVAGASSVGSAFQGLDHFDSRYSGGGNQFSGEPPDQGMCVGGGNVMEIVNSVVQVYSTSGTAKIDGNPYFPGTEPVGLTLNEFYGVAPSIDRTSGAYGLFMFDTSCLYDAANQRWFATSSALSQDATTGDFDGPAYTYIAVSTSADPLGTWNIWVLDNTNNGQNGTPDHHCSSGFCFGDYPQIGLDANGFYISTNEFDNLGAGEFHGAQLYAFSKADLIAGDTTPTMVYLQDIYSDTAAFEAYTLQPVNALPADWDARAGGTMYFGMSMSPMTDSGNANSMVVYALRHTGTLNTATPHLTLTETSVGTEQYVVPLNAIQKPGPTPLLDCANLGVKCWGSQYPVVKSPHPLDTGSGKVYGAWLRDGVIYLTTSTALRGTGAAKINDQNGTWTAVKQRVGVAYFAVKPVRVWGDIGLTLRGDGYAAVAGNNLSYPSIAVAPDGSGAIGATLVGPDYYPSVVAIPFTVGHAPTTVEMALPGAGPSDGFTGILGYYRARWGDYGAAAVDESGNVWLAHEYVNQSCSFSDWLADSTCGYTRTFYANWATGIVEVTG